MFGKKKCKSCGEKLSNNHSFCPSCGTPQKDIKRENLFQDDNWGMLGKMDAFPEPDFQTAEIRLPRGFDMLFKSLMKNLDKQFKEIDKEFGNQNNINSNKKLPPGIRSGGISIRRFADRVVYEIALPGVKSIKDISITKLENSIEIKAVSKDKAYFKLIP